MPERPIGAKVTRDMEKQIEAARRDGENKSDAIRRLLRAGLEADNERGWSFHRFLKELKMVTYWIGAIALILSATAIVGTIIGYRWAGIVTEAAWVAIISTGVAFLSHLLGAYIQLGYARLKEHRDTATPSARGEAE